MKKGEMPQLSEKWWKTNKGGTVKDVGLAKALEAYEDANRLLRTGESTLAYDEVVKSLKSLAPVVTKQIAACTKALHTETIDALKRYEPLIKQTWAEVHRDAAQYKDKRAQIEEMFDKGKRAIETELKKIKPAKAEADRLSAGFPTARRTGKAKKARAKLDEQAKAVEKILEKFDDLDGMLANLKNLEKHLGLSNGSRMDLWFERVEGVRECNEILQDLRAPLAEFSASKVEELDAAYVRQREEFIPLVNQVAADTQAMLAAVKALAPKIAAVDSDKKANLLRVEFDRRGKAVEVLRTKIRTAQADAREIEHDSEDPDSAPLRTAKGKLASASEAVREAAAIVEESGRAIDARLEELQRLAAERVRAQQEAQREAQRLAAEALKNVKFLQEEAKEFGKKLLTMSQRLKEMSAMANDHLRAKEYTSVAGVHLGLTANFTELAKMRNAAVKLRERLPELELGNKLAAQQGMLDALIAKFETLYTAYQAKLQELQKIPEVKDAM